MDVKRVLIVDDEADFREFVARVAKDLGFEATAVGSGAEFKSVYDQVDPDTVILDIVMPEEDGIELLNWLAARGCAARVLIVSGFNPHYRKMAKMLGGVKGLDVTTVAKPLRPEELEAALA